MKKKRKKFVDLTNELLMHEISPIYHNIAVFGER